MRDRVHVVVALADLDRLFAELDRCVHAVEEPKSPRGVEDVCVLGLLWLAGGERGGPLQGRLRLGQDASAPEVVRELGSRSCLLQRCLLLLPAADRLADYRDRLDLVVGEITGSRTAFEELRAPARRQVGAEAKRARVLCGGLPVRTHARRSLGRHRRVPEHLVPVGGLLGVVGEARRVRGVVLRVGERQQDGPVKCKTPRGRHSLLDGRARELVPERDGPVRRPEHSCREALVDGFGRFPAHGEQQPSIQ